MKKYLIILLLWLTPVTGLFSQDKSFFQKLSDAAIELTKDKVVYDPRYITIPYPNGDVPSDRGGVCTDVVIRLTANWV